MNKITSKILTFIMAAVIMFAALPSQAAETADTLITITGTSPKSITYSYNGKVYTSKSDYLKWSSGTGGLRVYSITTAKYENFGSEGVVVEYKFNVTEAGIYQLEMSAGGAAIGNLSYYSVSVDDGDFKAVSDSTSVVTTQPEIWSYQRYYKTPYRYYLETGEHSVKVRMKELAVGTNIFEIRINEIYFRKASDGAVNDIYIHGSDKHIASGLTLSVPKEEKARTGSSIKMTTDEGVFADGGYVISYPFTVSEPGYYSIAALAGGNNAISTLSKYAVSVDDSDYVKVENIKVSQSATTANVVNMQVYKRYALAAGEHSFNIHIYEVCDAGNADTYFDYVKLTRDADAPVEIYGTDGYKSNISALSGGYENTSVLHTHSAMNPINNYEGVKGKNIAIVGPGGNPVIPETGISLEYPFYVNEAGWYSLDLTVSKIREAASPIKISVDGGSEKTFSVNDRTNIIDDPAFDDHRAAVDTSLVYYFDEGMHTFRYTVTGISVSRGFVYSAFASAVFMPESSIDLISAESIEAGQKCYAKALLYENSSVAYSSDNSDAAVIDEVTGRITAVGAGTACITAVVTAADGKRISISDNLSVTVSGIWGKRLGIFTDREEIVFCVNYDNGTNYTITDYFGKTVGSGMVTADKKIMPGALPRGHYTLSVDGGESIYFSVIRAPEDRRNNDNSPFAVDGAFVYTDGTLDVEDYAYAAHLAGIRWLRERTRWQTINPFAGVYDFEEHDKYYDAFAKYGIKINGNFQLSPDYVKESSSAFPSDLMAAYDFAKTTAQYYDGVVQSWEVWNEPNTFVHDSDDTADKYAAMLKAMTIGYRDSGADVIVALSGIAGMPGSYFESVMQNEAGKYFDIYNFHIHRSIVASEAVSEYPQEGSYHYDFCDEYGLGDKPVWVTEAGIRTPVYDDNTDVTDKQQKQSARYLAASSIKGLSEGEDKHFWFLFRHFIERGNSMSTFNSKGEPYAVYNVASTVTNALGNGVYEGELNGMPDGVNGYVFLDGDEAVAALWAENETEVSLITNTASVLITDIMDNDCVKETPDGVLDITVGVDMQFVRIPGSFPNQVVEKVGRREKNNRAKELNTAERIVITQTYPEAVRSNAKITGYKLDKSSRTTVNVEVYNFNNISVEADIYGEAYSGWTVSPSMQTVELEPMSKTTLTFEITSDGTATGELLYPIMFGGVTDYGDIPKSVTDITASGDVDVEAQKDIPGYADASAWKKNIKAGGIQDVSMENEELSMSFTFDETIEDKWAYPELDFVQPEDFSEYKGIVLNVYSDANAAGSNFKLFLSEKNGSSYYTAKGHALTEGWQHIVFPWSAFSLYSTIDDNETFDLDCLESIKAGLNTDFVGTVGIKITDFGLYSSSAEECHGSFETLEYENGVLYATLSNMPQVPYLTQTAAVLADGKEYAAQLDGNSFRCELGLLSGDYEVLAKVTDETGKVISKRINISAQRLGIICDGVSFANDEGSTIYTIKNNDSVNASVTVTNASEGDMKIALIVASYDENGRMIGTELEYAVVGGKKTQPISVDISTAGCSQIKTFLWDSRQNIISDVEVID